jgi:hypothetical protein
MLHRFKDTLVAVVPSEPVLTHREVLPQALRGRCRAPIAGRRGSAGKSTIPTRRFEPRSAPEPPPG